METKVTVLGLDKLLKTYKRAASPDVIAKSLYTSAAMITSWVKKRKLSKRGKTTLGVVTGRLRSSISFGQVVRRGNNYSLGIGSNVKYARIHEFGGKTGRNHAVTIPARPYLRPSIENVKNRQRIRAIFIKNINNAMEKKL